MLHQQDVKALGRSETVRPGEAHYNAQLELHRKARCNHGGGLPENQFLKKLLLPVIGRALQPVS